MTLVLRVAALAFAAVAGIAGGLQLWVYFGTEGPRHLILGVFALSVGLCVTGAVIAAARRHRSG